jgi:alpha-glucosidase
MRHALGPLLCLALTAACVGEPRDSFGDKTPADAIAPADTQAPGATCGDTAELPPRTRRDDAKHTVVAECDGEAKELAVTVNDDGLVRLRYGTDDRGSIVPLDVPFATATLRAGRRGMSSIVCTTEMEVVIDPGSCTVHAIDVATRKPIVDDAAGDGFFKNGTTVGVARSSPDSERFFGLGLHTAAGRAPRGLDLRGTVIDLYNTDAFDGTAVGFKPDAPSLYESIPFYIALRDDVAYGVFTDDTHRTKFDLASSDKTHVRMTSAGPRVDQWLIAGPKVRDVVRRYTRLTGRTPQPAPWTLGFHQSRWEGPCEALPADRPFCSASQIASVAKRFRDDKIPADGIFLDIHHMNGFRSFTFDAARFANPETMVADLEKLGFKTHVIVDPGIKIDPAWDVYTAGISGDFFLKNASGNVFEGEVWPGPSVFPDFSSAKTRSWWATLTGGLAKRGIRGLWIDMNEPASFRPAHQNTVPDDVPADGDGKKTTMAEVHNAYAFFEAKASYEGMKTARPDERPFILSRAAFAGQQRYSAVWTGDASSTWTTLAMTLPQLLHLGLSGMAFAGSDVGGYSGRAESTPELFARWMALGSISPFFRAHAEKDARRQEPWAFGTETEDAVRASVSLRYELLPYLYAAFDETARTGAPVLRPLLFDFQDDPQAIAIADEAMLGPSLLVAPIMTSGAKSRDVYLPKGSRWFELRSGAVFEGGKKIKIGTDADPLPNDALPIFAREGAIIARTPVQAYVGETKDPPLYLDVFPAGPEKTTTTLYEDDGKLGGSSSRVTLTVERTSTGTRVTASEREGTYVAKHQNIVVRFRRIDHEPQAQVAFTRDEADKTTTLVTLPDKFPLSVELTHDGKLDADGDVAVPVRVKLPPNTPQTTAIHVATSRTGWTHSPLVRTGDEAVGTVPAPRGGWAFFKVTRGAWPTVEKGAGCAEITNRPAFGSTIPISVEVKAWADRCP